jgi:GNAT superfamily N-acetyltransferase
MIRKPKQLSEWEAIRRICCQTGRSGAPIDENRWAFFGENWIGPYEKLLPEWTWVASDETNRVIGYLTGCPDSDWLKKKRLLRFDLPLTLGIAFQHYGWNADIKRYLKRLFHLEAGPEKLFPEEIHALLKSSYPAHLHINLTEAARGNGTGRKLVETYFEALSERNVSGVHVFCGNDPVPFYKRLGFEPLHSIEFKPGIAVHCLGARLKT